MKTLFMGAIGLVVVVTVMSLGQGGDIKESLVQGFGVLLLLLVLPAFAIWVFFSNHD